MCCDGLSVSKDISNWGELINGWKMWIESEVLNNDLKNEQKKTGMLCFSMNAYTKKGFKVVSMATKDPLQFLHSEHISVSFSEE